MLRYLNSIRFHFVRSKTAQCIFPNEKYTKPGASAYDRHKTRYTLLRVTRSLIRTAAARNSVGIHRLGFEDSEESLLHTLLYFYAVRRGPSAILLRCPRLSL